VLRQRRATSSLYDLHIARHRVFWVAAVGEIIVFGSLMGGMFIGQQFMCSATPFRRRFAILPAAVFTVLVAALPARLVHAYGSPDYAASRLPVRPAGVLMMLLLWSWAACTGRSASAMP
jgi:hypothetical protein